MYIYSIVALTARRLCMPFIHGQRLRVAHIIKPMSRAYKGQYIGNFIRHVLLRKTFIPHERDSQLQDFLPSTCLKAEIVFLRHAPLIRFQRFPWSLQRNKQLQYLTLYISYVSHHLPQKKKVNSMVDFSSLNKELNIPNKTPNSKVSNHLKDLLPPDLLKVSHEFEKIVPSRTLWRGFICLMLGLVFVWCCLRCFTLVVLGFLLFIVLVVGVFSGV